MEEKDMLNQTYMNFANVLLHTPPNKDGMRELTNVMFTLTDLEHNILAVRDISPSYLLGELFWYFRGDNSLKFISEFSSFWNHLSDDGETCNSAYGYILQHKFGFNQIEKVIELLKRDPGSRRAVLNINTPNEQMIETKDEPCTIAIQFFIRNEQLNCTVMMRSNDIWFGLPYDVAFFTELQKYIAKRLNVPTGTYTHIDVSLHLYPRDFDKLKTCYKTYSISPPKQSFKVDVENLVKNLNIEITRENILNKCKQLGILTIEDF